MASDSQLSGLDSQAVEVTIDGAKVAASRVYYLAELRHSSFNVLVRPATLWMCVPMLDGVGRGLRRGKICQVEVLRDGGVVWGFPVDPFVTYSRDDESWCRYLGIGRELNVRHVSTMPNARLIDCVAESLDSPFPSILLAFQGERSTELVVQ